MHGILQPPGGADLVDSIQVKLNVPLYFVYLKVENSLSLQMCPVLDALSHNGSINVFGLGSKQNQNPSLSSHKTI